MIQNHLYIYGAGGMAQVVAEAAELLGYDIIGFIDNTPYAPVSVDNVKVFLSLPSPANDFEVIVAIGDCDVRMRISERLEHDGYHIASLIHPKAIVSRTADIGKGVFIAAGAVIDSHALVGDYTIVNINSVVAHGTTIGRACHLAPNSALAGNCTLGDAVWIGIGANVIEKCHLASRTFIGAGSVVIHDTNPNTLVFGVPAREMKSR